MNKLMVVLIVAGTLALGWPIMRQYGMDKEGNLYGLRSTDSFMHWAFAAEMLHTFPPQNPLFAGEKLFNYHYGSDLVAAMASKITGISLFVVLFKIMPIIYALSYGIAGWHMVKALKMNSVSSLIFVFLIYFGSSFSGMSAVVMKKNLSWNDALGVSQPLSYMDNQPLMLSLIWLMLYISVLARWLNKSNYRLSFGLTILGTFASMTKVLVAIPIFGLAAGSALVLIWKKEWKKMFKLTAIGALSGAIGIGILLFNSHEAGGLVWYPLQPLRRMIESPNFIEITNDVILRIQHYQSTNNYFRLTLIFSVTFLIYIFGNLGSRAMGILIIKEKNWLKLPIINYGLISAGFLCGLIPMFWFLKTGGFNINQLFYYLLLLMNIPAAIVWGNVYKYMTLKSKLWGWGAIAMLLLTTLPGSIWTIKTQLAMDPGKIKTKIYQDLKDLGNLLPADSIIVIDPKFINDQTNYISAISGRRVYLEALEYPRIQGHLVDKRNEMLARAFGQINIYKYVSELEVDLGVKKIGAVIVDDTRALKMRDIAKWRSGELYDIYLINK